MAMNAFLRWFCHNPPFSPTPECCCHTGSRAIQQVLHHADLALLGERPQTKPPSSLVSFAPVAHHPTRAGAPPPPPVTDSFTVPRPRANQVAAFPHSVVCFVPPSASPCQHAASSCRVVCRRAQHHRWPCLQRRPLAQLPLLPA
jgi:hypothetical protein